VEYGGEILFGLVLGLVAQFSTITVTFACAATLIAGAGVLVVRSRTSDP
jgi:hypothetical protein